MSDIRAGLTDEQRARLAARLDAGRAAAAAATTTIPPRPVESPVVTSFSQERFWLLDRLDEEGSSTSLVGTYAIRERVDPARLERCLAEIVSRHESLRTTFAEGSPWPVQVIAPAAPVEVELVDLAALSDSDFDRIDRARAVVAAASRRGFDLERGPLLRATLLRLADREHVLALAVHHIVADAWSLNVLLEELATLYARRSAGDETPLPPLPVQYADYAVWERERMDDARCEGHLSYWREQLADVSRLELPTDFERPGVQDRSGSHHWHVLDEEVARAVRDLAVTTASTPFMVLLAAFATVLGRYARQEDVVVGSFTGTRPRPELKRLIGPFVNAIPLRVDLSGSPTFSDVLARVRRSALDAYAHQELPFPRLLEGLRIERDPSRTPLFQVMLVLLNAPSLVAATPELYARELHFDGATAAFDLTLRVWQSEDRLACDFEYATALFDATTIRGLAEAFDTVLRAALENPSARVEDLPTAGACASVAASAAAVGAPMTLAELVDEPVRHVPDAVALETDDRHLTFRGLHRRAAVVAAELLRRGVRREERVGVLVRDRVDAAVTVLAAARAGATYVSLAPDDPPARLERVAATAGVATVVADAELAPRVPDACRTIRLDEAVAARGPSRRRAPDGEQAAYVVLTSGSTGTPKAVVVPHRACCSFIRAAAAVYGLVPADRVIQLAPLEFDAHVEDLLTPLAVGATVVVPAERLEVPSSFVDRCRAARLSVLPLPTAFWHELVPELGRVALPTSVRLTIIGGEAARADRVREWIAEVRDASLVNTYGPTEAAVVTTAAAIASEDARAAVVPLGEPIPGVTVALLDRKLRAVAVGAPGEIAIGGSGVARGYDGEPSATAAAFVPDSRGAAGGRIYLSGDVARRGSRHALQFLGRRDVQVKMRGYRVDPLEVEHELARLPSVREAAVVLDRERERLVAFVVPASADAVVAELGEQLSGSLPRHLIPSTFVRRERLPRMRSGKVDRRRLAIVEAPVPESRETVAPRSETEHMVAAIWSEVLGVDDIGVDDDFFRLGGHSLLATQVVSRVQSQLAADVPLRSFFDMPTVAELAEEVESRRDSSAAAPAPIPRVARVSEPRDPRRDGAAG